MRPPDPSVPTERVAQHAVPVGQLKEEYELGRETAGQCGQVPLTQPPTDFRARSHPLQSPVISLFIPRSPGLCIANSRQKKGD